MFCLPSQPGLHNPSFSLAVYSNHGTFARIMCYYGLLRVVWYCVVLCYVVCCCVVMWYDVLFSVTHALLVLGGAVLCFMVCCVELR